MPLPEGVAEIKAEIEALEFAQIGCTDTRILEVVEFRIRNVDCNCARLNHPRLADSRSKGLVSPDATHAILTPTDARTAAS